MSLEEEIRNKLGVHQYKDKIRVTQKFANKSPRYGSGEHRGLDLGEEDWLRGDSLYMPFDGTIYKARNWLGWNIGWECIVHSEPFLLDGKQAVIRVGYAHTRGKCRYADGAKVSRGTIVDISGGIFNKNSLWTGQHTHVWVMPRYKTSISTKIEQWQPNWHGPHGGYLDPLKMIEPIQIKSEVERVYNYYKSKGLKFFGWGARKRMADAMEALRIAGISPHRMLMKIYDYMLTHVR